MTKKKKIKLFSKEAKIGIYSIPLDYVLSKLFDCTDLVPDEYLKLLQLPSGLTYGELAKNLFDFPRDWEREYNKS